jgi:hypothetical protein
MRTQLLKYISVFLVCTIAATLAVKTKVYKAHLDNERRNTLSVSALELRAGAVVEAIGPNSEAKKADLGFQALDRPILAVSAWKHPSAEFDILCSRFNCA